MVLDRHGGDPGQTETYFASTVPQERFANSQFSIVTNRHSCFVCY